jgi:hypothetical protein
MIYAAINLAQQTNCWMHEGSPELASRASCMLMVFVNACATHLRNTSLDKGPDTRRLVNEGILEELELQIICTQPGWQPYYALDVLRSVPALAPRPRPTPHAPSTPAPRTLPCPPPQQPNAPPPSPIPGDRQGLLDARLPPSQLERGHEGGGVRAHGEHHRRPRQGHRRLHPDQGDGPAVQLRLVPEPAPRLLLLPRHDRLRQHDVRRATHGVTPPHARLHSAMALALRAPRSRAAGRRLLLGHRGWYTPILMGFICAMMMMLVEMGSALEDPFGGDVTDHPLEKYCKAVELQVAAVAKRHCGGIMGTDLAVPPSQRYPEVSARTTPAAKV